MGNKNISAKDKAFEKERIKYRAKIRELEYKILNQCTEIEELKEQLEEKEKALLEKEDWIERLLTYTELSEEDMKHILQSEKDKMKVMETFTSFMEIGRMFSSKTY